MSVKIIADRIVPFWLANPTGDPVADAAKVMSQRYLKADGKSQTQFNTGALVIREDCVLALTECQPARSDLTIHLGPPTKSRNAVVEDIRQNGPPLLAVLFRKGAIDVGSWVCSTPDEVVLNGPAGPETVVTMEDVALLRGLNGNLKSWRDAANLYAAARSDLSLAARLYAAVDKLAAAVGEDSSTVLDRLHRLHSVDRLAYELAAQSENRQ